MNSQTLSEGYTLYKEGKTSFEELKNLLHLYVYTYPKKHYYGCSQQDFSGEFWSFMEKRIPKYIKSFCDTGTPFGAYMKFVLRYQFITFLNGYIDKDNRTKMFEDKYTAITLNYNFVNDSVEEEAHQLCNSPTNASEEKNVGILSDTANLTAMLKFLDRYKIGKKSTARKRLWLFVLCHSPLIPKRRVLQIGIHLGFAEKECTRICAELEEEITFQRKKKKHLEERCNIYFAKRNIHDQKLIKKTQSKEEQAQNRRMRSIYNNRFNDCFKKLQELSFTISHSKLSKILQIPKGTIDSNIAQLRKSCTLFAEYGRREGLI